MVYRGKDDPVQMCCEPGTQIGKESAFTPVYIPSDPELGASVS